MHATGDWSKNSHGSIHIKLTKSQRTTCEDPNKTNLDKINIEFMCITIMKNHTLPVGVLACRLENNHYFLKKISINPAESKRAGPYTFQGLYHGHYTYDEGKNWLLLGSDPGLKITSVDGRRNISPRVKFTPATVTIHEKDYQ